MYVYTFYVIVNTLKHITPFATYFLHFGVLYKLLSRNIINIHTFIKYFSSYYNADNDLTQCF